MKVEIITIGDEILIGQIIETNSAWMAAELTKAGFEVTHIHSVGDSAQTIIDAIDLAFSRSDILLLTGGIGPTHDDITKNTLCRYFNTELIFSNDVLENILNIFAHRNISLNELTRNQALVPEGCTVIQNKTGTAPILWFQRQQKVLVSMPGVPFEMETAMTDDIIPRLKLQFHLENYLKESYLVAGITESALAMRLSEFEKELPNGISLAYLPLYGLIKLRLFIRNTANPGLFQEQTELFQGQTELFHEQSEKLRNLIVDLLVSENEKLLEELLGEKLQMRQLTISTAESCTGGLVAHKITSVAGASAYFTGSVVSYTNEVKERILDVDKNDLDAFGAVSEEVVVQMARNCAELLKTDCAIAISGIAGPTGGSEEKPVGTVWICTYCRGKSIAKKYNVGNSRRENIERSANMGMLQMLKMI
ncbi:MAG: CinA family nicotinamide mononucleotide deamidase-related protein [Proteiniphilum sp.]|uniref:CinA family nicotinamide mononucleotide deamidase-related protein n=1 Tax=Proteiniphilum sp. TaxID=1926877 RepID=UPI002B21AFA2|nr:CinA family nicotinamide mononucleotide deamidase-related protein [Proteiniphilum sp.]MEA5127846.1 CinA family nicotinamide mononucleotide deamidase-related protein [Proteiniphilum sp.]